MSTYHNILKVRCEDLISGGRRLSSYLVLRLFWLMGSHIPVHTWGKFFGVKIVLSGFTKDSQWWISAEKAWTQLFLRLTLLNMHL